MAKNHEELHFRCRIPIELIRHTNDRESPSGISAPAMAHILEKLALMLAPFAPYLSQEIWEELGNSGPAFRQSWPAFDPELAKEDLAEVRSETGSDASAVRAVSFPGNLGRTGQQRAGVSSVLAGVRSRACQRGSGRSRGAGERQTARPHLRRLRDAEGGSGTGRNGG